MSFGSKLSSYNTTTVKSFLKIKKYQLVWLNIYEYFMALCQFVRKKKTHTHKKWACGGAQPNKNTLLAIQIII